MTALDTTRVAEVVVVGNGTSAYGSGYRIAHRLVLTVDHVLGDPATPGTCTVRLGGGDTALPATPVWRGGEGRDLALLRLDEAPEDTVPPVTFGALPSGVGSVPFIGVGFPAFATRPEEPGVRGLRRRSAKQVDGFVRLGSSLKSRLLDLSYSTTPPLLPGPKAPDPWKGLSGAALFTRDSGLLIGVQAHRLPAAGIGGAEAEPVADALDDPDFCRRLALGGVRYEPRPVAPGDAPTEPQQLLRAVIPQHELIGGFGDFKKNLTPEHLPFVSPGEDHPAEPGNLFVQLVGTGDRGVLLVGAAGTGKTRAGIEVGRLALDEGWRVLHVLPGEDGSVTELIAEQVCAEQTPALVVVDYFNESQIDLPALRHRVIPEARRRGITVALLASVRPGWLQKANRVQLAEFFDEVELRQDDDFQKQVVDHALLSLAPNATERLGIGPMREICGHRPIVALLVAREVERRVTSGLALPESTGLREGGEIPRWLGSRLGEDELAVAGRTHPFVPARASHALVAAAAATAACPQAREDVTAAAHAALTASVAGGGAGVAGTRVAGAAGSGAATAGTAGGGPAGSPGATHATSPGATASPGATHATSPGAPLGPGPTTSPGAPGGPRPGEVIPRAEDVVATLLSLGWLETGEDGVLSVAHDLVTDQLVESVLLPERDAEPDAEGAEALLAGCLVNPRTVGRAALNIGRLVNDLALFDRAGPVSAVLNAWFVRHADDLGAVLRRDANVGGYALGAVCSGAPWSTSAVPCWSQVVGPWLSDFGSRVAARHLLYRGLHHLPVDGALLLLPTVWSWLARHGVLGQASFVLDPLVSRTDLDADTALKAIAAADAWLDAHAATPEAQFVLSPLLTRADLDAGTALKAIAAAHTWLDAHPAGPQAPFVLRPLLTRGDLDPEAARKAVAAAHAWLDAHPATPEARFVLRPVLARTDLDADAALRAIAAAHLWLDAHPTTPESQYVLGPLLARADLGTSTTHRTISAVHTWLDAHPASPETEFILRPLLSRADLDRITARKAITAAQTWLGLHHTTHEAQFVLRPLLTRTDLDADTARTAMTEARTWLALHSATQEAQFVLRPLLTRTDLDADTARTAVAAAHTWLAQHSESAEAEFVLGPLLRHLPFGSTPPEVRAMVDTWVGLHTPQQDFTYFSKWVLRQRLMSPTIYRALIEWAHANPDNEDLVYRMAGTSFHVSPYIETWEGGRAWLRVVELCLDHAERYGPPSNANGTLDALISRLPRQFRLGVGAAWADDCIRRWLALPFAMHPSVFHPNSEIITRCHALLVGGGLDAEAAARLATRLRAWVATWPAEEWNTESLAYVDTHMVRAPRPAAVVAAPSAPPTPGP
ncbi:hypothetical protein [Streptomyces sp. NPDC057695]|uniref:hypothetical protein n=1 Tax=Streptomyces sp. NPDC057695 TaxID=3346217 RepID=UPI0036B5A5DB